MLHIIANPASSSGAGSILIHRLKHHLKHNGTEAIFHMTTHPGHAGEIATDLSLTSQDRLMIVGGDGSFDELINGLLLPCSTPIILFPSGSGNDFARGMGLSRDPDDLLRVLNQTAAASPEDSPLFRQIDLGIINSKGISSSIKDHRFGVSCGFGMDAAICSALDNGKLKRICNKLRIGRLSYVLVGLKVLLQTGKKQRANLKISYIKEEGQAPVVMKLPRTAFISVHNTPYEGGGFKFCPDADAEDGYLNVCAISVRNRLLLIPILLASMMGARHGMFRMNVKQFRCKSIQVVSDRPLPLHTDGEAYSEQTSFSVSVLPKALTFLPVREA